MDENSVLHIPNGIDLQEYEILPKNGKFRKKNKISNETRIVLYLGRIHERKGIELLIEAFEDLINEKKFSNILLVIAGPDVGYMGNLKKIVKLKKLHHQVLFPGTLHGTDKLETYVDADVFVLPSKNRYESFGNTVLESCACGTPVVVTNKCGVSEWLTIDVGYVIDYNEQQMVVALENILNDEKKIDKFRSNCQKLAHMYDWNDISSRFENIYEELV